MESGLISLDHSILNRWFPDDYMYDAGASLAYMRVAWFKLDLLEKKLVEVKKDEEQRRGFFGPTASNGRITSVIEAAVLRLGNPDR